MAGERLGDAPRLRPVSIGVWRVWKDARSGKTLEAELAEVMEARRQGKDIRREPGITTRNDVEIAIRRAWNQFSALLNNIDLTDGPTLFWVVLIGLIVLSWFVQLFHF